MYIMFKIKITKDEYKEKNTCKTSYIFLPYVQTFGQAQSKYVRNYAYLALDNSVCLQDQDIQNFDTVAADIVLI